MNSGTIEDYRSAMYEVAEAIAPTWERRRAEIEEVSTPVREWMLRELRPRDGDTVLELAAGVGETGFDAGAIVGDRGHLISSDLSPAMLDAARRRGAERGVGNVEYRVIDAERTELDDDSVDHVLCRFGYMLMADPAAALAETRRVLRPGGRVALAAWAGPEHNPWIATMGRVMADQGHLEPQPPEAPGPLAFGRPGRIEELLDATGFDDIEVEPLDFAFHAANLDAWWEHSIAMSGSFSRVVRGLSPADHYALRDAVDAAYAPYVRDDGSLAIPARALVAAASA
jgi:ubiquinone/menaquinone biosynthesis C-methylase UbiE